MTVAIRPADLVSERESLVAILQRNLPDLAHSKRFSWLYLHNPCGPGLSWVVYEKNTSDIVGIASVFPRAVWVGREIRLCGQVGDFAVDRSHRALGPALMLQRGTFQPVTDGKLAFCYDCPPHAQGMSTFQRLGLKANCEIRRYARLLRCDRQIAKIVKNDSLRDLAATIGNFLLAARRRNRAPTSGIQIHLHQDRFGEEFSGFDELYQRGTEPNVIRGRRFAVDLNWRYRDDPLRSYHVLTARRAGELVGYLVFSVAGEDASIVELRGLDLGTVGVALIDAAADRLRSHRTQVLQFFVSDSDPRCESLPKAYFRYRSTVARVVAYAPVGTELSFFLDNRPRWAFGHGDILA